MPSSSPSSLRKSSYTRSASAWRPVAARTSISSWRGRSRSGSAAASADSSATKPSVSPRASRHCARTSMARTRRSSRRCASARPSSMSASSGYAGPCQRSRTVPSSERTSSPSWDAVATMWARRSASTSTAVGSKRYPSATDSISPAGSSRRNRNRWVCSAAAGSRGRLPAHNASTAASVPTTRPRRSTSSARRRRCSPPSGVRSRPSASTTRIGPSTST